MQAGQRERERYWKCIDFAKIHVIKQYYIPVLRCFSSVLCPLFPGGWWYGVPAGDLQYCIRIWCVVFWDPAQWAGEAALGLPDIQQRQGLAESWCTAQEVPPCLRWLSGERLEQNVLLLKYLDCLTLEVRNMVQCDIFFLSHIFCFAKSSWRVDSVHTHWRINDLLMSLLNLTSLSFTIWFVGSRNGACRSSRPNREWALPGTGAQDEQLSEPNGAVPCQSARLPQWQRQWQQVCGFA